MIIGSDRLYYVCMRETTLDTAYLRDQLIKLLDETGYTVEEIIQRSGVGKTTIYKNILGLHTRRTSVAVERKIAQGVGWEFEKVGDKFKFINPKNKPKIDDSSEKAELLKKIEQLPPETQKTVWELITQIVKLKSED